LRETAIIGRFIAWRDGIALSKAFINIRNTKIRRRIVALVEQIAELQAEVAKPACRPTVTAPWITLLRHEPAVSLPF
jgi:hypothetical protein